MSSIIASYFDRFPDFNHHPRRSIRNEFNRLAKGQRWDKSHTARQRAICYNEELEGHFADLGIINQLERLRYLCDELDVKPLGTIIECRKALRKIHVNLVDLINTRRTDTKVKVFDTEQQLRLYTKKTRKFYPLEDAKGDVVEVLLRRIP